MTDDYSKFERLLEDISREFDKDPDLAITATEPLSDDDLILFGRLIQIYNFSDLNARRIIDSIRLAAFGPAHQNGGLVQDAQVYEKLIEAAELLPDAPLRQGLVVAATTLHMHQDQRHHFAHWATRRVRGFDVFVFFTYHARQGEKRLGSPTAPEHVTFGLVAIEPIRNELQKLDGHAKWIAEQATKIHAALPEWKQHFADAREAERLARYEAGKFKGRGKGGPQK